MPHLTGHCLALFSLVTAVFWFCILRTGQSYSSFTKRELVQNSSIVQNSSALSTTFPTSVKAVSSNSSTSTSTSTSNSSSVSSSSATVVVVSVTHTKTSFTTSSSTRTVIAASNVSTAIEIKSSSLSQVSTSDSLNTSSISTSPVEFPIRSTQATPSGTSTSVMSSSTSFSVPSSSGSGSGSGSVNTSDTQASNLAPTSTVPVLSAASSGFWSNKSAVAGTFTVVALIIVALLAGLFIFLLKRRNRYEADYRGFQRYSEPEPGASVPPSETDASELQHPPMDPFADPTSYLDVQVQNYNIPQQLPAVSYPNPHLPPRMATNDELYDPFATPNPRIVPASTLTSVTTLTPGHPYASSRGKLAPVNFKESVERDSHRPSIDSFYGAVDSSEQTGTAH